MRTRETRYSIASGWRPNAKLCSWQPHNFKQTNKIKKAKLPHVNRTSRSGQGRLEFAFVESYDLVKGLFRTPHILVTLFETLITSFAGILVK